MSWHCTTSGRRCGGYQAAGWCTSLQYDVSSQYAFVGDYSGVINILKLQDDGLEVITALKGHQGSIRDLAWDAAHSQLASASFDRSVIVWDIGGGKGTAYELQGHHDKVQALVFAPRARQFISAGDDQVVVFWRMAVSKCDIDSPDVEYEPPFGQSIVCSLSFSEKFCSLASCRT